MFDFKDKTVLITGASRGIGKTIALEFARAKANVVITYSKSEEKAKSVLESVKSFGANGIIVKGSIENKEEAQNIVAKTIEEFKTIDILINNAGITRDNLILRMKDEEWDEVLKVNLYGTFYITREVAKEMVKARKGKIVIISSIIGLSGNAGQSNYATTKAGLIGFGKSLAKELAGRNINVNIVAPGFIETEMTEILNQEIKSGYLSRIPFKRLGTPEDISNAVLFLSSDSSSYITGQTFVIDGGLSLG